MAFPSVVFLILTMMAFTDHVHSLRASVNPLPVGSNVTLSSDHIITLGTWMFDGKTLVLIYPGGYALSINRTERMTFYNNFSSLSITSARLTDSGLYKTEEMNGVSFELQLSVQEPISNVTLSANRTDLVEFIDTAVLTCSVSTGSSLSYKWLAGNSAISSEKGVLSNGGATISIVGVTRIDQGPYSCNVSNGIGYEVSPFVYLNIRYGPSNTTVTVLPDLYMHRSGSDITLSCSADSKPPATFQWMVNDVYLNRSGSQLNLQNVRESNSGTYKCVSYNAVTKKFSNATTEIRVMDPVTAAVISNTGGPAIVDKTFTLRCEVTGPVGSIQWLKNENLIVPDNRTVFGTDNKTLSLNQVQIPDGGLYKCHAFNLVSNITSSPFAVEVNFGPETPTIMGPTVVKSGSTVTLSCTARSVPPSLYRWYFNGSVVSDMSEYTTPPLTKEMSGEYICMALNNVTEKNRTASILLIVVDPIQNVMIEALSNPAMEGNSYVLTCNITGPADHIHWMKEAEPLYSENRAVFSKDNMTVSFVALERSDSAQYQCLAINAVGNMTSDPYMLFVTYGPEKPLIKGPNITVTGDNVTFTCEAESAPPSLYRWYFNDSLVSNMSEYMTPPLRVEMSGKYVCMAINSISGKNNTASIMFTVIDPIRNVQVKPQINPAVEGDSFELTCSVNGTVDHAYWKRNGEQLHPDDRTLILVDNVTIRFLSIQRNDAGDYQCIAINAVGNMTSAMYMLSVSYGPEVATVTGPNRVTMGSNVTLSCYAPSFPPSSYEWYFNDSRVSTMSEYMTPPLTEDNSGTYKCLAFNNITGKNSTASMMLKVIGPIQKVQIDGPTPSALENYSYNLTCLVTGTVDHIHWMKNGGKLLPDYNTVFSVDNKTVMFMPVDRYDAGRYQCMATNAVGTLTSTAYVLLVSFGPETPIIYGPDFGETGRDAIFNCSATSEPPSTYTWWFNDSLVANTSELKAGPLSFNMSGKYTCMAHNHVTGQNITNSTMLTVIEAIESVMIQSNTTPINYENITLTCQIVGPYDTIYWMKDNMQLNMNASETDSFMYNIEENMLHFTPLSINSNGTYQCVATNRAAHHKSPNYALVVNYGPLNVTISGPESAKTGASVSLTCSADSQPECNFNWFLNNRSTPLGKGSVFNFSATKENAGKYLCIATHPLTNITMEQSKTFAIADHASASCIPSKGALLLMGLYSFLAHLLFL